MIPYNTFSRLSVKIITHQIFQLCELEASHICMLHDDIMKWNYFPRYLPSMRGIHQSPVNSPHTSQWPGALMFSLICTWTNSWANNRNADDMRCHCAHYHVTVVQICLHIIAQKLILNSIQIWGISHLIASISGHSSVKWLFTHNEK